MRKPKSRMLACVLLVLLAAATCTAFSARADIPTWLCDHLSAPPHDPTRSTIFFSKGIIAIGS